MKVWECRPGRTRTEGGVVGSVEEGGTGRMDRWCGWCRGCWFGSRFGGCRGRGVFLGGCVLGFGLGRRVGLVPSVLVRSLGRCVVPGVSSLEFDYSAHHPTTQRSFLGIPFYPCTALPGTSPLQRYKTYAPCTESAPIPPRNDTALTCNPFHGTSSSNLHLPSEPAQTRELQED